MRMKLLYVLVFLVAAVIAVIVLALVLEPFEKLDCELGDKDCAYKFRKFLNNCTPSVSIVTIGNGTNNITMRITVYREGSNCVIKEEVLNDSDSGLAPYNLKGYNSSCKVPPEKFEKFGPKACDNSLLSFASQDSTDSDGGGGGSSGGGGPTIIYCPLNDDTCNDKLDSYVRNCQVVDFMLDDEINRTENGTSYWTLYVTVQKDAYNCIVYHEIINAVNLPPEIPVEIVGMTMTCSIPLYKFPISWISIGWCDGGLVDYIKIIYP